VALIDANTRGAYAIAPTPFHEDGRLDLDSLHRLTGFYQEVGVDGVTVLGQMGEAPKLTHAESVEVVRTVCARTDLPVVVGVSAPGFGSMKHEDWPGLEKITALRVAEESDEMRPLSILCGNGGLFVDFEMSRGADGTMTGYCFPEMLVDVVRLQRERLVDDAHDLFDAHLPLVRYEQQTGAGLAVRKHVMVRRSLLASEAQRAPGRTLTGAERAEVDYLLTRLARRDPRAKVA
jgi:dihydrodipicolinate synthase/N-acetylneuraminate lyase